MKSLESFYTAWSEKDQESINFDVKFAKRKADEILSGLPSEVFAGMRHVVEVGCGYGKFLSEMSWRLGLESAVGIDYSEHAISYANAHFSGPSISFHHTASLDPESIAALIKNKAGCNIDCIILVDVLEHVPNALNLIRTLSSLCDQYLIKLPLESVVFDNYFLPKTYPGTDHPNGHVREFNANNVCHFIRQLGLTPVAERWYNYDMQESFPSLPLNVSLKTRLVRGGLWAFKFVLRSLLPSKWFLRLIGGGGYYCIAKFNERHILVP